MLGAAAEVSPGCLLPGHLIPFVKLSHIEVQDSPRGVGIPWLQITGECVTHNLVDL